MSRDGAEVARLSGRRFTVAGDTSFAAIREARFDRLADLIAGHLDTGAIMRLLASGAGAPPSLRLQLVAD